MRRRTIVSVVLLGLLVAAALTSSKLQWRGQLVGRKLGGDLPQLSWADVAGRLGPSASRGGHQISDLECTGVMKGKVRAIARGEQPCPVQWETPIGVFSGRHADGPLLCDLLGEQLVEKIYQRDPVSVQPGEVVLDAGANLGTFTRMALRSGARLVVAFEPEPTNATCFERNFRQELAERRVILVRAALWDSEGAMELAAGGGNSGGFSLIKERQAGSLGVTVRLTTIDRVVRELGLDRVDFIKMDIEGSERHAAEGGRETIARFGPRMVICVYHLPDDPQVIPRVISEIRPAYRIIRAASQHYFY
jgi:FkbM family methyltransferase